MEIIISGDRGDRELSVLVVSRRNLHIPKDREYFEIVTGPDDSKTLDKDNMAQCLSGLRRERYSIKKTEFILPSGKKDVVRIAEKDSESIKLFRLIEMNRDAELFEKIKQLEEVVELNKTVIEEKRKRIEGLKKDKESLSEKITDLKLEIKDLEAEAENSWSRKISRFFFGK